MYKTAIGVLWKPMEWYVLEYPLLVNIIPGKFNDRVTNILALFSKLSYLVRRGFFECAKKQNHELRLSWEVKMKTGSLWSFKNASGLVRQKMKPT